MITPLTHLTNLSIRECVFPKLAVVTALFKSGDPSLISNYRPISMLPVMFLEKVVAEQLINYLESNNLLHQHQFGFRPQHSTETAICYFLEKARHSLEQCLLT